MIPAIDINDQSGQQDISQAQLSVLSRRSLFRILEDFNLSDVEVSILFVSSQKIRSLNKRYLKRDRATDVIAFPIDNEDCRISGLPIILGDIVISFDRARIQAREEGHSLKRELTLLIIHGMLHLLGYDDTTHSERKKMFVLQEHYLAQFERDLQSVKRRR